MAESVDALVSNTSGVTSIPVRPRVWVLQTLDNQLIIKGFFFLSGVLKVYFLTKRKRKSTFAVLATLYLCFINEDAAYFFLSPAFVCFENGIHHLSL